MINYSVILQAERELQWQRYDGGQCVCDSQGGDTWGTTVH